MAAITLKQYNAIKRDAGTFQGTRAQLAEKHGVSERTVRKVLAAETWGAYLKKNEESRKKYGAKKARAEAQDDRVEMPPVPWGDSGLFEGTKGARALEDDLVIQDPDAPKIVDEIHEYPTNPPVLIRTPAVRDLGQISPEVCGWIRKAADLSPELRGIIGALAVWSPEHLTEHLALLHDSLDHRSAD